MKSMILGAAILGLACCNSYTQQQEPAPPAPAPALDAPAGEVEPPTPPPAGLPGTRPGGNPFGRGRGNFAPTPAVPEGQSAGPRTVVVGQDVARAEEEIDSNRAVLDAARNQFDHAMANYTIVDSSDPFRVWTSSSRGDRPLVIRTSEADAKTLASTEEDLNIMSRILEKSALQSGDDGQPKAMSIPLVTMSRSHPRNFQIEGYGAIFMLNVNFPLAGPASNKSEENAKEPSNSTWDETKRELYGPPRGSGASTYGMTLKEDYDPKRVDILKDAILGALKNAANMHSLKSDESVAVVVTGGSDGNFVYRKYGNFIGSGSASIDAGSAAVGGGGGGGGRGWNNVPQSDPAGQPRSKERINKIVANGGGSTSTMTIRAKKSDIDAFATGKLNLEEFRNKVKVLVY